MKFSYRDLYMYDGPDCFVKKNTDMGWYTFRVRLLNRAELLLAKVSPGESDEGSVALYISEYEDKDGMRGKQDLKCRLFRWQDVDFVSANYDGPCS